MKFLKYKVTLSPLLHSDLSLVLRREPSLRTQGIVSDTQASLGGGIRLPILWMG